jgi:hypothetical protein
MRPLPGKIARWTSRLRWLRWGDAGLAWITLLLALGVLLPQMPSRTTTTLAAGILVVGALMPPLRRFWRPVSATTTFLISRGLRPGDRAWFVHGRDADLVLVTARHGVRVVIAKPGHDAAEGMSVRRTRVLLLPAAV